MYLINSFQVESQNNNLNNIFFYSWLKHFENRFIRFWFIDVFTLLLLRFFHYMFLAKLLQKLFKFIEICIHTI